MGVDGIAISADGERLYYCPLASRSLYSVKTGALRDRSLSKMDMWANVINEGDKGGASDGLESDNSGTVYCTNYEDNAIFRRNTEGVYDTVVHDRDFVARHPFTSNRWLSVCYCKSATPPSSI